MNEYNNWWAYYQIEPFGELRQDFRVGQLCATVVNMVGSDDGDPLEATDFIPTYDSVIEQEKKDTIDGMNNAINDSFAALKAMSGQKRVNI